VKSEEPRVRIVVKKAHGRGHHGGAWKVAYADFVTTMMALFIVLWIVGQSAAMKEAIAQYFKHPGVNRESATPALAPGGAGLLPAQPAAAAGEREDTDGARDERALREAAERIKELIDKGGTFEGLREQVSIKITPEGLRIELMERDSTPLFRVGSAVPVHPLKPLLENLEKILGTLPNNITIEGHTDGRQYSDRKDYSNWELSTDRANSARRILETEGMRQGQIDRVVGHADRILRVPEEPLHASNRRISLLVRRQPSQ
jgi:chemotaxis protein MotB